MKAEKKGPDFGDEMIADMRSLVDTIRSGEPLEKRFTVRTTRLDLKPKVYGPEDVKKVRATFGASQALFARFLGVNVQTLQKWEAGTRKVPGMAARYLDDVQEFPDLWTRRLQAAAK